MRRLGVELPIRVGVGEESMWKAWLNAKGRDGLVPREGRIPRFGVFAGEGGKIVGGRRHLLGGRGRLMGELCDWVRGTRAEWSLDGAT